MNNMAFNRMWTYREFIGYFIVSNAIDNDNISNTNLFKNQLGLDYAWPLLNLEINELVASDP